MSNTILRMLSLKLYICDCFILAAPKPQWLQQRKHSFVFSSISIKVAGQTPKNSILSSLPSKKRRQIDKELIRLALTDSQELQETAHAKSQRVHTLTKYIESYVFCWSINSVAFRMPILWVSANLMSYLGNVYHSECDMKIETCG